MRALKRQPPRRCRCHAIAADSGGQKTLCRDILGNAEILFGVLGAEMDFHLEHQLKIESEVEFKNLYNWAINELDKDGNVVGVNQIPYGHSAYFTGLDLVLGDET